MRRVLAIIPAYNEEESLQTTVEELKAVAPDIDFVVVNDGSSDDTAGVCRRNSYPIPAYNEEESLQTTVEELKAVAPDIDFVVVNDGSSDDTAGVCRRNSYPMIDLPVNGGLTVGFQTGMKYALRKGYDAAVQFDADGQHMPQCLECMIEEMDRTNADIVIGSRFVEEKKDFSARMMGSRLISMIIRLTTGKRIADPTSGARTRIS